MRQQTTPTLKDIAKQLRLTASTVSRAMNDHPGISSGTKEAVMRVAKQVNYQPNHIAAALRKGKSNIIGLIVPTIDKASYSAIIKIVEEMASKVNYKLMICQSYDLYQNEVTAVNTLLNAQVDGVIVSPAAITRNISHLKDLKERGVPLLLFGKTINELNVNQIVVDYYQGAYSTVTHLIQRGCKKIAHLAGSREFDIYKDCLSGYKDALNYYGIPYDKNLVIEGGLQPIDGRNSMIKFLSLQEKPDAVFAANDFCLLGAMQVLKEYGLKVPKDVALAGFGNEKFAAFSEPPLTSVDHLSASLGSVIGDIFFTQIARKNKIETPQTVILQPKLLIRQSTLRHAQNLDLKLSPSCYLVDSQEILL